MSTLARQLLAPLTKAGFRRDREHRGLLLFDGVETQTHWQLEVLGEGDDITLCCRIAHPKFEDAQTLDIELGGVAPKVRKQVALAIATMAEILDATNYDRLIHQLLGSGLTVLYRDGWLKAARAKGDLPRQKLARRKAFIAACRASKLGDTSAYDGMFDAGITVSPEARAETVVRGGRLTLDYYVHRDFLELIRDTDTHRLGLRVFRPHDLVAAVALLARLRTDAGPARIAEVARALLDLSPIVGLDSADGWQVLSLPKRRATKKPAGKKKAPAKKPTAKKPAGKENAAINKGSTGRMAARR